MNKELLLDNLRCIPDWPIKGVNFRDVTTLFKSPEALQEITDEMVELYEDKGVTKIVGIESRGFVMSSSVATQESSLVRPYRRVIRRNTAWIQSKFTRMLSTRMTSFSSTTTSLQQAER